MKKKCHIAKILLITGLMMLSFGVFYGITNSPRETDSKQPQTKTTSEETQPLSTHEDWTATEEQFENGFAGKKPEDIDNVNNGPRSAHFASTPMPTNLRVLVILVEYSDYAHTLTKAAIYNKVFGASNSLKDYYEEVSYNLVTMTGNVTEWLTLPNTREYYGRDTSSSNHDSYYGPVFKYHEDSVNLADPVVDYSQYDRVIIIHAGDDQAASGQNYDMWSHAYYPYYGPYFVRDGVGIYTTSCLAELEGFGTICHEFGHQNNLPDLYDYNGVNNYMDHWCLMDAGSWNGPSYDGTSPAHMTAYCKNYLGFIPADKIRTIYSNNIVTFTLDDLETGGSNWLVAKLPLADADHYYLIEARFGIGYDAYLPNIGLLVTKVDNTINSGYGIVNLMDSHPSTASKDDGELDDTVTASDVSAFDDDANNIHVIVVSRTSSTYTLMVIRSTSFAWYYENLPATTYRWWNWPTLTAGQQLVWNWVDTVGGSNNLDSWVTRVGVGNYESVSDYQHDAGVYRIPAGGSYNFTLQNRYGSATDYKRELLVWTTPTLGYTSVYTNPSTVYLNGVFQLTVTIRNTGGSTADGISLTVTLPAELNFDTGEVATHTVHELGYYESYTAVWNLKAVGTGTDNIHVACSSTYGGSPTYDLGFTVQLDSIAPSVNWVSPNFSTTKSSTISISWSGFDGQSGLKNFEIYVNGTKNGTVSGTEDTYDVDNLYSARWNITVRAIDYANNINEVGRSFLVDSVKPNIIKFNPSSLWVRSNGLCSFTGQGSDILSGVASAYLYYRTSGNWILLDSTPISTGEFEVGGNCGSFSVFSVDFKLNITDAAGNENESSIVTLYVDDILPSLSGLRFTSDSKSVVEYSGLIHIWVSAEDSLSGIDTVNVIFTAGGITRRGELLLNLITGLYQYTFDSSGIVVSETVTFVIVATDVAGNSKFTSQSIQITNGNPMLWIIIGVGSVAGGLAAVFVVLKKKGIIGSNRRGAFNVPKIRTPGPELAPVQQIQLTEIAPPKMTPSGSIATIPVQESRPPPPPTKQPVDGAMQRFESGKNYINLKQLASAENAFREAVRMDPTFAKAWYHLGLVIRNNPARYEEAEAAFRMAIKYEFANPLIWANLGFLLNNMGRVHDSKAALQRALALAPKGWGIEDGVKETIAKLEQQLAPSPVPQPKVLSPIVEPVAITPTVLPKEATPAPIKPRTEILDARASPPPAPVGVLTPLPVTNEEPTPAQTTKVCPKCAQVLSFKSKFCNKCGSKA